MKTKSLYIASLEPSAGSLIVTMGIMELLKRRIEKVAFFRPVIEEKNDEDILFILEHFNLDMEYSDTYGYSVEHINKMASQNRLDEVIESLIEKFKKLEKRYDFVLCEGLHKSSFASTLDFDINLEVAKNLTSPFISVLNGKNKSAKEILEEIAIEAGIVTSHGCSHFATFANRLEPEIIDKLIKKSDPSPADAPVYFLPETRDLDTPTIGEIMKTLDCTHILGSPNELKRVVRQSKIAAMFLENFLEHIEDGDLIIVPGDRADIIMATIAANYSKEFPSIAGILLTGGLIPGKNILKLINGLSIFSFPILSTQNDTYTTAMHVQNVPSRIYPDSDRKIALAMGLFFANIDSEYIEEKIAASSSDSITPMMFKYSLFERARQKRKKIVLPESGDERILRAAEILLRRDVVDLVLLGDPEEIRYKSASLGLDISKAEIIDPSVSGLKEKFASEFYHLRKHKGLSLEAAEDAMSHLSYFATMMVYKGYADGMVSGAAHTTQDTIRPALQIIKTKKEISIVSSVFFMCLDTQVLVYGDCAVNQEPNASQLAEIAISSALTAKIFGIEPRVAMLSYSTGSSGAGEDVEKVKEATRIAKERRPDLMIEGPIQYDAAIDPHVAEKKLPGSKVAGRATVFVFPDLNTGNNTYKAVQRSSGAIAIGPVLQGLNRPVNDLSRGCLVEDIVNTVAITAIQASILE